MEKSVYKSTLMGYVVSHRNPFYISKLLSLRFTLYYVLYYAILSTSCSQASVTKVHMLSFSYVIHPPLHILLNISFLWVGVGKNINYEFQHYAVFSALILFYLAFSSLNLYFCQYLANIYLQCVFLPESKRPKVKPIHKSR
jgi:hypothetical protein